MSSLMQGGAAAAPAGVADADVRRDGTVERARASADFDATAQPGRIRLRRQARRASVQRSRIC
jgi:hypothetical protein